MQIPTKEIEFFVVLITLVFLLAPATLILLVNQYNLRKKRHMQEKSNLQKNYESEIAKARVEVQEQTLQTMGADLHDNIGQLLSLTNLTLKSVDESDPEKTRTKVDTVIDLTSRSIRELRLLGKLLQGEQLIRDGLVKAIAYELQWLDKLDSMEIKFHSPEKPIQLNPNQELMAFRMFQEVINNTLKHAKASLLTVTLQQSDGVVVMEITDNGAGFKVEEALSTGSGLGLSSIRHRAEIIGGRARFVSEPGKGTLTVIEIPFDQPYDERKN